MFTTIKRFSGFPCTHRQPTHDGHCKWVHGYSRWFEFEFWSPEADPATMFVQDFGKLKWLKDQLTDWFDHTMLVNADDPELERFKQMEKDGLAKLTVLPNVGMEACSLFLWSFVEARLRQQGSPTRLIRCTVGENEKNSGQWVVPFSGAYSENHAWLYARQQMFRTHMQLMGDAAFQLQGVDTRKYLHPEWVDLVFQPGAH